MRILTIPNRLLIASHPRKDAISVIIFFTLSLISDAVFILLDQGRRLFAVILDFNFVNNIDSIFRIHGVVILLLVLDIFLYISVSMCVWRWGGGGVFYFILDGILKNICVSSCIVSLVVLLTLLAGRRKILRKLKHFTYAFIILEYYCLKGFGDAIQNIPYVVFKDTVVLLTNGFYQFRL